MARAKSEDTGPPTGHWTVHNLPSLDLIRERLPLIFPEGLENRGPAVAERAARSVFVFLYAFAVEGVSERRLRPAMVTTMSDSQAAQTAPLERWGWWESAAHPRSPRVVIEGRWYAENTREPIRDETFRVWREYGALLEDAVATTSSAPRYRLAADFADLFDPSHSDADLRERIAEWQARHLTAAARARVALLRQQSETQAGALIRFPDGASRYLALGPSSALLKAAVEEFAPRFLRRPVVLLVTESRQRLAYDDAAQLALIGLRPDPRVMPDLLLADLGVPGGALRLVFLECVATAGAMTGERMTALRQWLAANRFGGGDACFGTVFADRSSTVFRRDVANLAWGTFVWFASEPDHLLTLLSADGQLVAESLDALAS